MSETTRWWQRGQEKGSTAEASMMLQQLVVLLCVAGVFVPTVVVANVVLDDNVKRLQGDKPFLVLEAEPGRPWTDLAVDPYDGSLYLARSDGATCELAWMPRKASRTHSMQLYTLQTLTHSSVDDCRAIDVRGRINQPETDGDHPLRPLIAAGPTSHKIKVGDRPQYMLNGGQQHIGFIQAHLTVNPTFGQGSLTRQGPKMIDQHERKWIWVPTEAPTQVWTGDKDIIEIGQPVLGACLGAEKRFLVILSRRIELWNMSGKRLASWIDPDDVDIATLRFCSWTQTTDIKNDGAFHVYLSSDPATAETTIARFKVTYFAETEAARAELVSFFKYEGGFNHIETFTPASAYCNPCDPGIVYDELFGIDNQGNVVYTTSRVLVSPPGYIELVAVGAGVLAAGGIGAYYARQQKKSQARTDRRAAKRARRTQRRDAAALNSVLASDPADVHGSASAGKADRASRGSRGSRSAGRSKGSRRG